MLDFACHYIPNHSEPDLSGSLFIASSLYIEVEIANRVKDTEESVRKAAVTAVCEALKVNPTCIPDHVMLEVGERLRDKKVLISQLNDRLKIQVSVRHEALHKLAELYSFVREKLGPR